MTATVLHLPTARSLASIDVARLTDSRTYARGVDYGRRGRVLITHLSADSVTATVTGSVPYQVRIEHRRHGLEHGCTCPVGVEGGFCKHLVATALAVPPADTDEADDGDDTDGSARPDLRSWLATLDKHELVELIASAAEADDGLARRLARHGHPSRRPTNLAAHRRAMAVHLERAEDDGTDQWEADAHQVVDAVEELFALGHATQVVEFCEHAIDCLERNASQIRDLDALRRLGGRLGDLHVRACLEAPPDPIALARRITEAEMYDELGVLRGAMDRYAAILGPRGLAEYHRLAGPPTLFCP